VAPDCGIVVLKVMDAKGNGKTSHFLRAIDWTLENKERYGIRIANISAGMGYDATDAMQRRLLQAIEYLWNQGIIVMTAAGNNGPGKESITVPGILRTVITVGSSDDRELQNRGRKTGYSGEGPTRQCIVKPELVAPGTNILSCSLKNKEYVRKSGTSMATPVASGALALLLEKYPYLTPPEVKLRLYHRLKTDFKDACWGTLNVRKLLS
jgi:serine protease AprX